jgi:hypothetical protein
VDGNLTIEVNIQVYQEESPFWKPKSKLNLDMLKILESAEQSSDVEFQVGAKKFSAHRLILEIRAPELAALADGYPSNTPIPIQGIKPPAFRTLLRFVYANAVPESEELRNEASDLLDAANRFSCKGLKFAAEAEIVASGISVDTAADMILFGDSKSCALLKEAAILFFVANLELVMSSPGWANITESLPLMKEIMEVLASEKKRSASADKKDYKHMRISVLRMKLDERGLDVDGSREMLIKRLEEGENNSGSDNSGISSNEDKLTT